jgi:hypothetical protein
MAPEEYPNTDAEPMATVSAPLFVWSGQVDLIPLQQALAGFLLTLAAVLIALRLPREAP